VIPARIKNFFRRARDAYVEVFSDKATSMVAWEERELTNIFAVLVLGMFVGLPSPPAQITLELLPEMEDEFWLMLEKVETAQDPLAEMFSVLEVE
jgi:hypothetical protein